MSSCLFCKIIAGDIPSKKVFENDDVYAFEDINPMAKKHYLFIAKSHTKNINEMTENSPEKILSILSAIRSFTQSDSTEEDGFRIVTNTNKDGGQTVFHTHFHVLAGEQLKSFGA